ncbi:MAG: hypothetical protein ACRYF0_09980 [Janthinobacterium lividum]
MKLLIYAIGIALFSFTNPSQRVLTTKPLRVENPIAINTFTASIKRLNLADGTYKFKKTITQFDESYGGKLITFSFSGDTIQYYKADGNQFLYYCNLSNPAALSNSISFLLKEKNTFIPNKYLSNNKVRLEDIAGFEDLDLTFSANKIKQVIYISHPD